MIGVLASRGDSTVVEEFFELFKTPWEPAVPGRRYEVVLSAGEPIDGFDADLYLVYAAGLHDVDVECGVAVSPIVSAADLRWGRARLPIYGRVASVGNDRDAAAVFVGDKPIDYRCTWKERTVWRIGYDLFAEVRTLLTTGQPVANSAIPTLDVHIALLRQLLLHGGITFVEIPPRPHGFDFICCLTHDVDFYGIRRHRFDRTMAGFAARASVGTFADFVRGRRPFREVRRNWSALASLPFVHAGLARDFWAPFDDYARADGGRPSTFFLVPVKAEPGVNTAGAVEPTRAVPYQASEVATDAKRAAVQNEIAVHGINAWRDEESGRREMAEVTSLTGRSTAGVRMHWLYFDEQSPARLEAAGFDYDSTCGYNETIGYRAGTAQAFRPLGVERLLELPLTIMDSSLFSGRRSALDDAQAAALWRPMIAHAREQGGALVINWHERSVAPERLWERHYCRLLSDVADGNRVWFATAKDVVDWFRARRSIRFESAPRSDRAILVAAPDDRMKQFTVVVNRSDGVTATDASEFTHQVGEQVCQ